MELNHIKEFIVLAKTENYSDAAEKSFISQSSLSKHIQSLERELGVRLFDRTRRSVKLNDAGKIFLRYASQIVELQHQCNTELINFQDAKERHLTIGSIPLMAPYGITDILLEFKKRNVKINIKIIEGETQQLKEKIRNGACDLAFIRRFLPHKSQEEADVFSTIKFTTDYLVAVLPRNHPLATEKAIELTELKDEEFLFLPPASVLYTLCLQACRQAGFTPKIAYTGKRAENIIDLVSKGMGISLLTAKPVAYINTQNLVSLVPVLPRLETEIVIYYKKDITLSKAASHFLDFIQQ